MAEIVRFSNDDRVFEMADRLYAAVEGKLRRLLREADVRHVGSTAVPGSMTKGDLDVVVRVQSSDFRAAEEVLAQEFDRNAGSERTNEFAAFMDASTVPNLGIQLVAVGGAADTFHVWVEQLLNDPALLQRYDELKLGFEGRNMEAYRSAKTAFIAKHIRR